ncbi:cation diffusion facilitator family transporter [Marinilabilia sp.]|uniref:cation diffusion facilitator family transporter n=1 Tax=Marinilabilia sp. TaxID=2021252 RepID=UPI0025B9787F|nr:cation diffusion facilitator family transporter [Marinilabilia sp.]
MKKEPERIKLIKSVTVKGSIVNLILSLGKITAGITGKSSAMLADGIHSLSDLITDLIVLMFIGVSGKERDKNHHYGHGKFETFATMLIGFALALVGIGILWSGIIKIIRVISGETILQPGIIALYAALISIVAKEILFWYTYLAGKKTNSSALKANAWHHRSDAFSSVATALGISGALFLGEPWRILDPLAGVIVSFFILKIGWEAAIPSIKELLENSLPSDKESAISEVIESREGVLWFHNLRTRRIGEIIAVDVHIKVDKNLTVEVSHKIATQIENKLKKKFGENSHIGIHVEPFVESKTN